MRAAPVSACRTGADARPAWEELGRLLGDQREAYLHCQLFLQSSIGNGSEWKKLDERLKKYVRDLPGAVDDNDIFARLVHRLEHCIKTSR